MTGDFSEWCGYYKKKKKLPKQKLTLAVLARVHIPISMFCPMHSDVYSHGSKGGVVLHNIVTSHKLQQMENLCTISAQLVQDVRTSIVTTVMHTVGPVMCMLSKVQHSKQNSCVLALLSF